MATLIDFAFEEGSKYRYSLMQEESITIVFTNDEDVDIPLGTTYNLPVTAGLPASAAGRYILITPASKSVDAATGARQYTVTLDKDYWMMQNFLFKYIPANGGKEASWILTAHIGAFVKILKQNFLAEDMGITDVVVSGVGEGGAQALSFSSSSILDAVNSIAAKFCCEWWVKSGVLYFGKCKADGEPIDTFDGHVEYSEPLQGVANPNKWYVFGSSRNIPYWYRKTVDTKGVELTFNNYNHSIGDAIALTAFGEKGEQSLVNEGEQTTFLRYGMKATVTPGEYVWINFDGCTANITRDQNAHGEIFAYIQYSDDDKEYITMERIQVSDITGDTKFSKTKTYFKSSTGTVYLRMLIEFHTDEDGANGYINISPTFTPKVNKVVTEGLKLGTLPMSCFKSSDISDDVLKSAVVQNRLMLDAPIDMSDGGMVREAMLVFEDVYPKSLHDVVLLNSKEYVDEIELADGTKEKQPWRAYRMKAPSFLSIDDILSGKTLAVHFETGPLAGMEFDVSFTQDNYADGVLEIIRNERYGRWLPDATLFPQGKYALLNFDVSANADDLIDKAHDELQTMAEDYISTISKSGENVECTMRVDIDETYDMGAVISTGLLDYDETRIVGIEIPLDLTYDHPKYTIGNSADYSRFGALKTQIDGTTKDGGDYTGRTNIYVIRQNDATPTTNDNVYSAKRSDDNYLSKIYDDSVRGFIAFAKGLASMGIIRSLGKVISLNSFESTDYKRNETGFYLGPEFERKDESEKAESRLEVDNLYVRNALQYRMLNIKRRTYIGGSLAVTCGSAELIKVYSYEKAQERIKVIETEIARLGTSTDYEKARLEELNAELAQLSAIPKDTFRCWFKNEQDGMKINNDFVAGDYACNETLNLEDQSYYWRKVTRAEADYVDLSASVYDTSRENNEPQAGDVIVQLGHESNKARQNAIFIKADSADAPAILTYHGISTFRLEDHEAIMQKYDPGSGTMKLTVYGDAYVGNRGGSSYLKFSQSNGLEVMADKMSLQSTTGKQDISQTISDLKKEIDNIDIDGENYAIWFFDHTPTNDNEPAKNWSAADKVKHEGDLLYNRTTGEAWRYVSGSWVEITDADTIKALEEAKKKKRVFTYQPGTDDAYDLGDLWVNATYGSYHNDILKCAHAKKAGEPFSINHWSPASFAISSGIEQMFNEVRIYVKSQGNELKAEFDAKINGDMAKISAIAQSATDAANTAAGFAASADSHAAQAEINARYAAGEAEKSAGVAVKASEDAAAVRMYAEDPSSKGLKAEIKASVVGDKSFIELCADNVTFNSKQIQFLSDGLDTSYGILMDSGKIYMRYNSNSGLELSNKGLYVTSSHESGIDAFAITPMGFHYYSNNPTIHTDISIDGIVTTGYIRGNVDPTNGVSGSFETADGKTVSVTNGIITRISESSGGSGGGSSDSGSTGGDSGSGGSGGSGTGGSGTEPTPMNPKDYITYRLRIDNNLCASVTNSSNRMIKINYTYQESNGCTGDEVVNVPARGTVDIQRPHDYKEGSFDITEFYWS